MNFGDIVVNSITIKDDGHGGFITAYNQDKNALFILELVRMPMDMYRPIINMRSLRHILVPTETWMGSLFSRTVTEHWVIHKVGKNKKQRILFKTNRLIGYRVFKRFYNI